MPTIFSSHQREDNTRQTQLTVIRDTRRQYYSPHREVSPDHRDEWAPAPVIRCCPALRYTHCLLRTLHTVPIHALYDPVGPLSVGHALHLSVWSWPAVFVIAGLYCARHTPHAFTLLYKLALRSLWPHRSPYVYILTQYEVNSWRDDRTLAHHMGRRSVGLVSSLHPRFHHCTQTFWYY